MILALDVGNTNITIGLFEGDKLARNWRPANGSRSDVGRMGHSAPNRFTAGSTASVDVEGIIISSVVPPLDSSLAQCLSATSSARPHFVYLPNEHGVRILYDNPQ
jgi:type III pantothenate kinase